VRSNHNLYLLYCFVLFKDLEDVAFQLAVAMSLADSQNSRPPIEKNLKNNLYVNNFGKDLNDAGLRILFQCFGRIVSAKVMKTETGKSRGFGFVCFETDEEAESAIK